MTICIAALSDDGQSCVVAADRELTVGFPMNIAFEHHERKIEPLSPKCLVLSAGNALIAEAVAGRGTTADAGPIPGTESRKLQAAACLTSLLTNLELRARIRKLMASGALPSEPPVVSGTGDVSAVKNPLPAACSVCGERDPQITLFYVAGLVVRLHSACDALWQQERQA